MQDFEFLFLTNNNTTITGIDEMKCPAQAHIPEGVEKIEKRAFADCPAKKIFLPDSVQEVGYEAFCACDALEYVSLSKNIFQSGGALFRGCLSLEEVDTKENSKIFSEGMFENCPSLKKAPLVSGMTEIPRNAFSECSALENVEIPEGVAVIRSGAFAFCSKLKTVILPASLKIIEDDAFRNCESLCDIRLKGENVAFFLDEDSGCLFERREKGALSLVKVPTNVKEIRIPANTIHAHSEAFQGCGVLEKVHIDCELLDHPLFVALKTEIVNARIIEDFAQNETQNDAPKKPIEDIVSQNTVDFVIEQNAPEITQQVQAEIEEIKVKEEVAEIIGQNLGANETEAEDKSELSGILITPEEFDEAVMRGIQEEEEEEYKIPEGVLPPAQNSEEAAASPPIQEQEPRFVNGMKSVCEAYEVFSEHVLFPERCIDELLQCQPCDLEAITTLVVVTEALTEKGRISGALKKFCVDLARKKNLKRVYFFGALSLDNEEFLYGFSQFALYRNVIYATKASNYDALSAEIKSFSEIAEISDSMQPFQNVAQNNALQLEEPFKIFVQDNFLDLDTNKNDAQILDEKSVLDETCTCDAHDEENFFNEDAESANEIEQRKDEELSVQNDTQLAKKESALTGEGLLKKTKRLFL